MAQTEHQGTLAGSEWVLTELSGEAVPDSSKAMLQFRGEGALAGHSGCNRFSGTWNVDGGRLMLNPGAMTRMACPGPQMRLEYQFIQTLAGTSTWTRDGINLTLENASGDVLARLRQTDWD
ncbi:META domain-containing protein [Amaricoccus tamworthensis]|uniref:META domain-containing protein n=1 Tax=Amaricoccus tamworthensis TaxID=57002 RepID=UPI003C7B70C2